MSKSVVGSALCVFHVVGGCVKCTVVSSEVPRDGWREHAYCPLAHLFLSRRPYRVVSPNTHGPTSTHVCVCVCGGNETCLFGDGDSKAPTFRPLSTLVAMSSRRREGIACSPLSRGVVNVATGFGGDFSMLFSLGERVSCWSQCAGENSRSPVSHLSTPGF